MKTWKRMLSCVLALALLVCLLPAALAADGEHWASQAVDTLNEIYGGEGSSPFEARDETLTMGEAKSILDAVGWSSTAFDDSYDNDDPVSRAKACDIVAEVFNLPVPQGESAITYLNQQNIINGYADGSLGEQDPISKAQFAVITYRVLNAVGGGAGSTTGLTVGTTEYNAWMFLTVRGITRKSDGTTDAWNETIDEERWGQWIHDLDPALKDGYDGEDAPVFNKDSLPPCPGEEDDPATKLEAAVALVKAYEDAGGSTQVFVDVAPGDWYYDGVMYLFDHGIVMGYGSERIGQFGPNDNLTNGQLASLLCRVSEIDTDPGEVEDKWVESQKLAIKAVNEKGWMTIAEDSYDTNATRQTAITALVKWMNVNVSTVNTDILERFKDGDDVSTENAPYVAYAVSVGILSGDADGNLRPDAVTTRAMFGVIMYRVLIGVDTTKMKDYEDNVAFAKQDASASTIATFALRAAPRAAATKTLTLTEDWRLTSDLDLNVPAGETLTIVGNGHHIYEMGGILTNSGTGTVVFATDTYLYPAEGDKDAATIKGETGYDGTWDEEESAELMRRRQPQGEAEVDGVTYATLAEAIAAAGAGETVTLLTDVTVSVSSGAGDGTGAINLTKNITIDGDDHTISADDESFDMTTLWGTTVAGKYHVINVMNGASVTLKNLTIDGGWDETEDATAETGNAARSGINVYGENTTVTVENVTVQNCSVYGAVVNGTNASLTASELTTAGNRWGVNADNSGSVTIKSGTINEEASLVVEGGSATVEGGTFKGAVGVKDSESGTLLVKDGNFAYPVDKDDLDTSLNAELKSASNPDAPYSYYKSLDEATKAAQPGDVVKDLSASTGTDTNVTVTFADGYFVNDTMSVPAGSQITLPTPERSGYTFLGWYDASGAKVESPYTVSGAVTLTARWRRNSTPSLPIISGVVNGLSSQVQSPFVDVTTMDYYYDAVNWAVENDITTGTGRYTFSPDEACTRAQAVTFLWRAAGSPTPKSTSTPFVDVDSNAYYYKAVLWAVENGVTIGTSATTFSPSETCTRAQIVTFLYRAFGRTTSASTSFTDVSASDYYAPAVAWAAANSITGGTGNGKFSPEATCTRAQIVTFLYRCCG